MSLAATPEATALRRGADEAAADAIAEFEALERAKARARPGRAALVTYGIGGAFALLAIALPLVRGASVSPTDLAVLAGLAIAYAAAFGVQFEIGPGAAVPTQLALVPMLVLCPPTLIPLAVGIAILARAGWDEEACTCPSRQRPWALLAGGWHTVGAVAVVLAAGSGQPGWQVIALATALQIGIDAVVSYVRAHGMLGFPGRALAATLAWTYLADIALTPVGYAIGVGARALGAPTTAAALAGLIGFLALVAADRRRHLERARKVTDAYVDAAARAHRDALTGLANRLRWEEAIDAAVEARSRVAVIVVDVDGLKVANDTRGHAAGDAMLGEMAAVLVDVAGGADVVARLGGDEFGVLLVGDEVDELEAVVARLRGRIAGHPGVQGLALAASIGYASTPPEPDVEAALAAADVSLYREKAARPGSRAPVGGG